MSKLTPLTTQQLLERCDRIINTGASAFDIIDVAYALKDRLSGAPEWRPISDVARMGDFFWLSDGFNIRIGLWLEGRWADMCKCEELGNRRRDLDFTPTHFQFLPAPPKKEE